MRARNLLRCGPWLLALPLMCLPVLSGVAQVRSGQSLALPALGDGGTLPLGEERRLGDQIARSLYRHPDYLDDPALAAYLQALWQPLLQTAQAHGNVPPDLAERFAWVLMPIRDKSVNAFALPGGYMGVNLGLIAAVATADELASVLAHEMSHVSQRHIARLIDRQGQQAPWMLAAMVLGAIAASQANNADIAQASIAGGQALAMQTQLNFSRDMEREADRVGFGMMTEAGYDGLGFVTMFEKLQQASRLNDDGSFPYLRSHPLTTERMADMRSRVSLEHTPASVPTPPVVTQAYHAMMSARAKVLAETDINRLRGLAAHSAVGTDVGERYAAVLAAAQLRDAATAWAGLALLLRQPPADAQAQGALDTLKLEVWLALQGTPTAPESPSAATVAQWRDQALASGQRQGLVWGARVALPTGAAAQQAAVSRLLEWSALHPDDALVWQTLATLHNALGQPVLAARAEAEARVAQLDLPGALERFRSAQRLAQEARLSNHFDLSILDARVRQIETRMREQLREERGPER